MRGAYCFTHVRSIVLNYQYVIGVSTHTNDANLGRFILVTEKLLNLTCFEPIMRVHIYSQDFIFFNNFPRMAKKLCLFNFAYSLQSLSDYAHNPYVYTIQIILYLHWFRMCILSRGFFLWFSQLANCLTFSSGCIKLSFRHNYLKLYYIVL